MRALLQGFLREHPRAAFYHCGAPFASVLADAGYYINPYGVESRVPLPLDLRGSRMRGIRRQVAAAKSAGVAIRDIADSCPAADGVWRELRDVDRRWIEGRVQPIEVKRATRRAVRGPEKHTTKVVARNIRGDAVGWACLDHICERGDVIGVGLSVVRSDPGVPGVSTLLACEGARLCAERYPHMRFLDLGVSPLAPVPDGIDWNPLAVCAEDDACIVEPPRAALLDALLTGLFRWGSRLYNTPGLAVWKRKWRPREELSYVCSQSAVPLREIVALLVLLVL